MDPVTQDQKSPGRDLAVSLLLSIVVMLVGTLLDIAVLDFSGPRMWDYIQDNRLVILDQSYKFITASFTLLVGAAIASPQKNAPTTIMIFIVVVCTIFIIILKRIYLGEVIHYQQASSTAFDFWVTSQVIAFIVFAWSTYLVKLGS